jgi:hypothetical protein
MAIVQNPITGRTRKAFGTAVFAKQFSKNTMRTKPIQVKNPKTPGQVRQRNKFLTIVELIRQVIPTLNVVYAGSLSNMSPFNKMVSHNLKNAFTGMPPLLDHTKVVLCTFKGSTVKDVTITALPDQVMKIDWSPNTTNPDELASQLTFILFNCTNNEAVTFNDVALRSAGTANVTVPDTWVGALTTIHIKTIDFAQVISNAPKQILKYKAQADLANVVK